MARSPNDPAARAPAEDAPALTAADEQRIMARARHDPASFAPLYHLYFPRVYAYCRRRTASAQEAEDLTSQVFTRALAGLEGYRGGAVAAWLFRIARNTVINHYRDRRPDVALDEAAPDLVDDGPSPPEVVMQAETLDRLRDLVAALPGAQQDLLALKLVGGLTSDAIGDVLGKSPGAVRVALHRIIARLRAAYAETAPEIQAKEAPHD
jgi:RNA polymerase sigma-70 factor (ECF subfamily)